MYSCWGSLTEKLHKGIVTRTWDLANIIALTQAQVWPTNAIDNYATLFLVDRLYLTSFKPAVNSLGTIDIGPVYSEAAPALSVTCTYLQLAEDIDLSVTESIEKLVEHWGSTSFFVNYEYEAKGPIVFIGFLHQRQPGWSSGKVKIFYAMCCGFDPRTEKKNWNVLDVGV